MEKTQTYLPEETTKAEQIMHFINGRLTEQNQISSSNCGFDMTKLSEINVDSASSKIDSLHTSLRRTILKSILKLPVLLKYNDKLSALC